jgi:hypothetical protein
MTVALCTLLGLASSAAGQTKDLTFRFSDAKAAGKLTIRFVSQNFATFGIKVEVDIPAGTMAAAKRDLVSKAIQDAFKKELPNDDVAKAFTYNNEANPPAGTAGLVMGNIPIMIGKTLFGLNANLNSGKTKEGRDGVITSFLDPGDQGFIQFASLTYDPNDNGSLAVFNAGVTICNMTFFDQFTAPSLGTDLTGQEIAHQLWLDLEPQVSPFANIPDPGLTNSNTLFINPLTIGQTTFGVEFGTTSPSGEVIGGLQSTVPEPASILLLGMGALSALGLVGWRRSRT